MTISRASFEYNWRKNCDEAMSQWLKERDEVLKRKMLLNAYDEQIKVKGENKMKKLLIDVIDGIVNNFQETAIFTVCIIVLLTTPISFPILLLIRRINK